MTIVAALMSVAALQGAVPACQASSPAQTVAVVELYTSQGCSSCPPADRWLSQLPSRVGAAQAIALAFHVGYWDYIGWQDPFARREFTDRQRWMAQRAAARPIESGAVQVYTPEVFIGGREIGNWSDPAAAARAIDAVNARPARAAIELSAAPAADAAPGTVKVSVQARPLGPDGAALDLRVALTQSGHSTAVSAGENRGATLHDDHVVRSWLQPPLSPAGGAQQLIALPADGPRSFALVALAQDRRTGEVLQALELPLRDCAVHQ